MKNRFTAIFLAALLCFGIMAAGCGESGKPVEFPNVKFETRVRAALEKPEGTITQEDLALLTSLDLSYLLQTDISGIEYCVNLEDLDLSHNALSDLSLLSGLTKLTSLNLDSNRIDDLTPLANCTHLVYLSANENRIDDLSPLADLINLKELRLNENAVSNFEGLAFLEGLQLLSAARNPVTDITALGGLIGLEYLDLGPLGLSADIKEEYFTEFDDLTPISNLRYLRYLNLDIHYIRDISPLAQLTAMEELSLMINRISDVSPLTGMTRLKALNLYGNTISDLRLLAEALPAPGQNLKMDISYNPLDEESISTWLPLMKENGIQVSFTPMPQD